MTIIHDTSFEAEPAPIRYEFDGPMPPGLQPDVGDGESGDPDIVEMWCINKNDNPSLNRLPPYFVAGDQCIWGKIKPDPDWSTECFLMKVIVDPGANSLYVSWDQCFKNPVTEGGTYLPIFWNFVRKMQGEVVLMYTQAMISMVIIRPYSKLRRESLPCSKA